MNILLFGGTGQIGGAVAREVLRSGLCTRLTLIARRDIADFKDVPNVVQVVVDTGSPDFENAVREIARGHDAAICCVGIGSGTLTMSLERIMEVEVHLVGRFARGCKAAGIELFEALTAVGSRESQADSLFPQIRALGLKHKALVEAGFSKLALFQPGIIVGNAHTPRWITPLTRFIPDSIGWGNVHLDDLSTAFASHLQMHAPTQSEPVVCYGNREIKRLAGEYSRAKRDPAAMTAAKPSSAAMAAANPSSADNTTSNL